MKVFIKSILLISVFAALTACATANNNDDTANDNSVSTSTQPVNNPMTGSRASSPDASW